MPASTIILIFGHKIKKSSKSVHLKDILSKEAFSKTADAFGRNFGMLLETTDLEAKEARSLCSPNCHPEFCQLIKSSKVGAARCKQDRLRSLNMAIETGQPHITICHAGGDLCVDQSHAG